MIKTEDKKLADLKKENERLDKLVCLKSDLISISAHQLRTSLSACKWILQMFLDGDLGEMTTEQKDFIGKAIESNERMINVVTEMLEINKTEDTILTYNFKNGDIVKLIENVVFDFTGEAYKKDINMVFLKPKKDVSPFHFDQEKIRVVLQNLIENAIKYSNKGGKIFITIKIKKSELEISVKDTGIGISKINQKKIFSKFFRADNAKRKEMVGSGLGLYTIKEIVARHGGKLWFKSEEHVGSTFFFTLPFEQKKVKK